MEVDQHCWEHLLLCKGRGDKLLAMLQAQEMDGVRRRQIDSWGRKEILIWGNTLKFWFFFFHATHCLAPGWFKTMLFFQRRFSPSNLLAVQLFHFVV